MQIRSQTAGGPKGRVNGPQVEIESTKPNGAFAGYVYGEAAGGWMTPDAARKPHKIFKNCEWNSYRCSQMVVTCRGPHVVVELNGEKIIDTKVDEGPMKRCPPAGSIGGWAVAAAPRIAIVKLLRWNVSPAAVR